MSTKNLNRSYVEPGHEGLWNSICRRMNRKERHEWRRYCNQLTTLGVDPLDQALSEERFQASRFYTDRSNSHWNPAKRWLMAQAGRPWHKVQQDLHQALASPCGRRWKLRRLLLQEVHRPTRDLVKQGKPYPGELYVNRAGILCLEPNINLYRRTRRTAS